MGTLRTWNALCERLDCHIPEDVWGLDPEPAFGALGITYRQLQDILWGRCAPDKSLLSSILEKADIAPENRAQYHTAAAVARRAMPVLSEDGKTHPPETKSIRQHKPEFPHREPEFTLPLRSLSEHFHISSTKLKRAVESILAPMNQTHRAHRMQIIPQPAPLHAAVMLSNFFVNELKRRGVIYDLVKPPKGWFTRSDIRRMFTDSSITANRLIGHAVAKMEEDGVPERKYRRYAHNAKRALVPFYAPVLVETMRSMGMETAEQRRALPQNPAGYLNFSDALKITGGDFNALGHKIEKYRSSLPADAQDSIVIEARGKGGVRTRYVREDALTAMQEMGMFDAQAHYRTFEDRPHKWLSSSNLSKTYMGNKAKMIRIVEAFQTAVLSQDGAETAAALIGHYKWNGKIGIFISPKAAQMLEAGYNGLSLTRR